MENVSGIYKIYCLGNKKAYIGSSVNVRKRRNQHLHHLRKGNHPNSYLQHSYDKYGEFSFSFSLVLECEPEQLLAREENQIKEHKSFAEGFNLVETPTKSMLGFKHSEETKAKLSAAANARKVPTSCILSGEQVRQMRQEFFDGERNSALAEKYQIHRKTVRECVFLTTHKHIPCDIEGYEEMIENLKEAKKRGERPRSRGWKHSEEFKEKLLAVGSKPWPADKRALTPEQIRVIRYRAAQGETYRVLSEEFGVNQNSISKIVRRLTYKDVT